MKGHIVQRGKDPKAWSIVLELGRDPQTGKRKQKWISFRGTKREAQRRLNDLLSEMQQGTYVEPVKTTLAEFARSWLKDYVASNLRPTTYANYEQSLRLHALPVIGAIALADLQPAHIQKAIAAAQHKGLAPKTVRHVYAALHRVLSHAVKWGMLPRNPADVVDRPRVPRSAMSVWSEEQAAAFLVAARSHRLFAVFWLAITTGMRRGEVLGLNWSDVDLERRKIGVCRALVPVHGVPVLQEPKTAASVRSVAISAQTVTILREHRAGQDAECELLELPRPSLIFTSVKANPVDPRGIHRVLDKLTARAGVPRIRFHDLRHTCATLLLRQGLHPKVVAERLGHRDVGVTLNTYSHVQPDMQEEAAATMDAILLRPTKVSNRVASGNQTEEPDMGKVVSNRQ